MSNVVPFRPRDSKEREEIKQMIDTMLDNGCYISIIAYNPKDGDTLQAMYYPKDNHQASYIMLGLLDEAKMIIRHEKNGLLEEE